VHKVESILAIVGAGGIGCALGHALLDGGVDVTLVERDREKIAWGREHGVAVDSLPPHATNIIHFDEWRPNEDDLVLLCTKCYDNPGVLEKIPAATTLIPIQNGYDTELSGRVEFEAVASFVTECTPGRTHTRITRPGELHIGFSAAAEGRRIPHRIGEIIDVLDRLGNFAVRTVPEVLPYKNTKLMYNAAISPIAAVAGLDNGQLLTMAGARRLFFGLIRENYRILKNAAAPLERIGPFHPDTVDILLRVPLIARLLAVPFSRTLRGTYCSMAGDLPNGPTELDNYNGYLLSLAGDLKVPVNRRVYEVAQRVEREGHQPDLKWLEEIESTESNC
jgi:2-dehydropantoate 2-reductase